MFAVYKINLFIMDLNVMHKIIRKSEHIDICLLLEGTFPYVKGGVSTWAYQLIKMFPHYRFGAIFLGGVEEDYPKISYDLPENLVHLEAHFLFQPETMSLEKNACIDKKTQSHMEILHDYFASSTPCDYENMLRLVMTSLFSANEINKEKFLYSKESWNFIYHYYQQKCPENSFISYFWNIRNMHEPLWRLVPIAKNAPPAKIYHSLSTGYAGVLGAFLNSVHQAPLILTEHGIYTKERWIELLQRWWLEHKLLQKDIEENDSYLVELWIHFFESLAKIAYIAAKKIISIFHDYQIKQIEKGAPAEKTLVISNTVEFNGIRSNKQLNRSKPIIGFIGRIVPIKDVKTFIRAAHIILQRIPQAEIWLIGSESEDPNYVKECKALANLMNDSSQIKFLGEQNVEPIYEKIDLVVLTSISEGVPLVILEAFAAGTPVVATDVGGCSQLIYGSDEIGDKLGSAGRIVDIANPSAVAQEVCTLIENQELWQEAQSVCYKRVEKFYNTEKFKSAYLDIYEKALNQWQA